MKEQVLYSLLDNEQPKVPGQLFWYWLFALLFAASELIFAFYFMAGTVLYLLLFGALVVKSFLQHREPEGKIYLCLTLVPLIRIFSVAMPFSNLALPFWFLIISVPLFLSSLMTARIAGYSPGEVGFTTGNLPLQLVFAASGVVLGWFGSFLPLEIPSSSSFEPDKLWLTVIVLIVCTGFLEELIFRGIIYRAVFEQVGKDNAMILVSFLNASLSISNLSVVHFMYVFEVALILNIMYEKQRSLLGISLAHGIINITLFLIRPGF